MIQQEVFRHNWEDRTAWCEVNLDEILPEIEGEPTKYVEVSWTVHLSDEQTQTFDTLAAAEIWANNFVFKQDRPYLDERPIDIEVLLSTQP